jgi:hypothetical protein
MKFLYLRPPLHLVFKWRFTHADRVAADAAAPTRDDAMPLHSEPHDPAALNDRLRDADAVTAELMIGIIDGVCRRFPSLGQTEKTVRLQQMIATGAWTDAALALIDLELPQWQVRRIAYDEGEWHCALSRERELPDWLDSAIEARHADLALAILAAFVDARCATAPSTSTSVPIVPRDAATYQPVCCDNFG